MSARRFHIALGTDKVDETVADYAARLGAAPVAHVPGEYALWRVDGLNVSIRKDAKNPGALRHLGFEDPAAEAFTATTDVNGIVWERFAAPHQAEEIEAIWPGAGYRP